METVGAHHKPSADRQRAAVDSGAGHTGWPALVVAHEPRDVDAESNVDAGVLGCVDEDWIEYGATWGVQRIDAVGCFDAVGTTVAWYVNVVRCTGGAPAARTWSSSPQRWSCRTAARMSAWVDVVSANREWS